MKHSLMAAVCVLTVCHISLAQTPTFQDHAVPVYQGKIAKAKITSDTQMHKTRFRALSQQKVNFAGHYVVDWFGCGTNCIGGVMLDARTGKTDYFPTGAIAMCPSESDENDDKQMQFHANSRLFALQSLREDPEGEYGVACYQQYYVEENGKLRLLSEHKLP